jgi:hypothetical protein
VHSPGRSLVEPPPAIDRLASSGTAMAIAQRPISSR